MLTLSTFNTNIIIIPGDLLPLPENPMENCPWGDGR